MECRTQNAPETRHTNASNRRTSISSLTRSLKPLSVASVLGRVANGQTKAQYKQINRLSYRDYAPEGVIPDLLLEFTWPQLNPSQILFRRQLMNSQQNLPYSRSQLRILSYPNAYSRIDYRRQLQPCMRQE